MEGITPFECPGCGCKEYTKPEAGKLKCAACGAEFIQKRETTYPPYYPQPQRSIKTDEYEYKWSDSTATITVGSSTNVGDGEMAYLGSDGKLLET